ncbi:hypothetical protein FB567DRAFT_224419 [Paraphoma chrysanthemicola]|uniref:Uncharacterized protein n=1 Tax=Paraphoma chrysanthemicola TaxID=798071 RepID=A0A8K0QSF8_9PLEO|nr:hypothetical protein FB567DRAFT_224419 [Paraphoma chrysanthemicola]
MRSSTYIALFAGSAAAQSTVTLFNLLQLQSTLTQVGADSTATTYKNDCPANNAGISAVPSQLRPTPDASGAVITPAPSPTPRARLARQMSDDEPDYSFCEPFTLKQGPSTWEFHLTDPTPGAWTVDIGCNWKGAMTAADLTCTYTQSGYVPSSSVRGVSTSILSKAEASDMEAFQVVTVVTASGAASASASRTSGSGTSVPSASRAASGSAAGSAAASQSTGLAPAGPLPTGAVALVGGALGIFAAALAL